jgi:hypothetical protein
MRNFIVLIFAPMGKKAGGAMGFTIGTLHAVTSGRYPG